MKSILKHFVTASFVLTISCTKEPFYKPETISTQSNDKSTGAVALPHFIGERFGGGIVFYLSDSVGRHGLIADTSDLPQAVWSYSYGLSRAFRKDIGTGEKNTLNIVRTYGKPEGNYASWECYKSSKSGYKDWYLPSKDELYEMYTHKTIIGGFNLSDRSAYWSSSEHDQYYASVQYFLYGENYISLDKTYPCNVRAIRSF